MITGRHVHQAVNERIMVADCNFFACLRLHLRQGLGVGKGNKPEVRY